MQYKAAILDMDGVIWRADQEIGKLSTVFRLLSNLFTDFTFCTNNSTHPPKYSQIKLQKFGITFPTSHIITSSIAIANLLSTVLTPGDEIHVIGEDGLMEALRKKGFIISKVHPSAVVVGMDRHFSYKEISEAVIAIRNGVPFYGTNPDMTFPTSNGLIPGAGSIIELIRTSSGIEPIIAGKPNPYMLDHAMRLMNSSPSETLVIGDRLDTDILGGISAHCPTAIVLSGVTDLDTLNKSSIHPDIVAQDLTELLRSL